MGRRTTNSGFEFPHNAGAVGGGWVSAARWLPPASASFFLSRNTKNRQRSFTGGSHATGFGRVQSNNKQEVR